MSSSPDHIYLDLATFNNDTTSANTRTPLYFTETRTNPIIDNPSNYYMTVARFEVDTPSTSLPMFIPKLLMNGVNDDANTTCYSITIGKPDNTDPTNPVLTDWKQRYVQWSPQDKTAQTPNNSSGTSNIPSGDPVTEFQINPFVSQPSSIIVAPSNISAGEPTLQYINTPFETLVSSVAFTTTNGLTFLIQSSSATTLTLVISSVEKALEGTTYNGVGTLAEWNANLNVTLDYTVAGGGTHIQVIGGNVGDSVGVTFDDVNKEYTMILVSGTPFAGGIPLTIQSAGLMNANLTQFLGTTPEILSSSLNGVSGGNQVYNLNLNKPYLNIDSVGCGTSGPFIATSDFICGLPYGPYNNTITNSTAYLPQNVDTTAPFNPTDCYLKSADNTLSTYLSSLTNLPANTNPIQMTYWFNDATGTYAYLVVPCLEAKNGETFDVTSMATALTGSQIEFSSSNSTGSWIITDGGNVTILDVFIGSDSAFTQEPKLPLILNDSYCIAIQLSGTQLPSPPPPVSSYTFLISGILTTIVEDTFNPSCRWLYADTLEPVSGGTPDGWYAGFQNTTNLFSFSIGIDPTTGSYTIIGGGEFGSAIFATNALDKPPPSQDTIIIVDGASLGGVTGVNDATLTLPIASGQWQLNPGNQSIGYYPSHYYFLGFVGGISGTPFVFDETYNVTGITIKDCKYPPISTPNREAPILTQTGPVTSFTTTQQVNFTIDAEIAKNFSPFSNMTAIDATGDSLDVNIFSILFENLIVNPVIRYSNTLQYNTIAFTAQNTNIAINTQDISTGYYNCYTVKWWLNCVNKTLYDIWVTDLGLTAELGVPQMVVDANSNLVTLMTPQNPKWQTTPPVINMAIIDNLATTAGWSGIGSSGSTIYPPVEYSMFFNEPLFNLFSAFPFIYYGPNYFSSANVNPAIDLNLIPEGYAILSNYVQPINYESKNYITVGQAGGTTSQYYYLTESEYSPVPMWNPISALVFTTSLLPVQFALTNPPQVYGSLPADRSFTQNGGNNAQISNQISDIEVPMVTGSEYKPQVIYYPSGEYRCIDLLGNSPIFQASFSIFYKTKFGALIPFALGSQCGANIKILFRRKRFNLGNVPPYDTN